MRCPLARDAGWKDAISSNPGLAAGESDDRKALGVLVPSAIMHNRASINRYCCLHKMIGILETLINLKTVD